MARANGWDRPAPAAAGAYPPFRHVVYVIKENRTYDQLFADLAGGGPEERLRSAVAHGAAAASLPGSTLPTPADVDLAGVSLVRLPDPAPYAPA